MKKLFAIAMMLFASMVSADDYWNLYEPEYNTGMPAYEFNYGNSYYWNPYKTAWFSMKFNTGLEACAWQRDMMRPSDPVPLQVYLRNPVTGAYVFADEDALAGVQLPPIGGTGQRLDIPCYIRKTDGRMVQLKWVTLTSIPDAYCNTPAGGWEDLIYYIEAPLGAENRPIFFADNAEWMEDASNPDPNAAPWYYTYSGSQPDGIWDYQKFFTCQDAGDHQECTIRFNRNELAADGMYSLPQVRWMIANPDGSAERFGCEIWQTEM